MSELFLHNRPVDSVFQLLGEHENDMSYSVGWVLAQCPSFLHDFLSEVAGTGTDTRDVTIRLQQHETAKGITDIELLAPGRFHVIVEAKRGWNLPTREQLETYAARESFVNDPSPLKRLVVFSECSREYARQRLEAHKIEGLAVQHLSWKEVVTLGRKAQPKGSNAEKRLIGELLTYLGRLITMQNLDSNWVYVVALAKGKQEGWDISWIDIVKEKRRYFHPMGSRGWPKQPPNYMAFRYDGKLQSIHHVDDYEVITDLHKHMPEIPSQDLGPLFFYRLGEPFGPSKKVRMGNLWSNGRVWCMLDTLFTCDTVAEAGILSRERSNQKV